MLQPFNASILMSLNTFLEKIRTNTPVSFNETIAIITEHYHNQPTEYSNGLNEHA